MNGVRNIFRWVVFAVVLVAVSAKAGSGSLPFVSPIFGDHMVLQRGKPNTVWGWTKPGSKVRVEIGNRKAEATAGKDGKWEVQIRPPKAGGPYTMTIDGLQHVKWADVLVGDVWLCTGQSNMEMGIGRALNGPAEIKTADHPNLRLCVVHNTVAYAPAAVPDAAWRICAPETLGTGGWEGFSAVGYFFGRRLQQDVDVPIGLIQDCWGGTPAESWTSAETLHRFGGFDDELKDNVRYLKEGVLPNGSFITHWYNDHDVGQRKNWKAVDFDDHDWKTIDLKTGFDQLGVGDAPAVCYFRKTVHLPDPLPSGQATIQIGHVERMDTVYINGQQVGSSSWVDDPRKYKIDADVLKPGANVITIRIIKTAPDGGFRANPATIRLVLSDQVKFPLAKGWKGRLSVKISGDVPLPHGYGSWPEMPAVLYNGMIAPVTPLAITGAIWYQGEANVGRAAQYRKLLPAMIGNWRASFGQGDFPFYIVSLAAFMPHRDQPGGDAWTELREAQDEVAHSITNSGLAVTVDIGDAHDIHPRDKKDVGDRLGRLALAKHYGKKIPFSGPRFVSAEPVSGGALRLHFDHTNGGLVAKDGKPGAFSVAGDDGKWYWADARIEGNTIVVSSPKVPQPKNVHYAWQSNPTATLYNGAGLPAVPFRTDHH